VYYYNIKLAVVAGTTIILGGVYMLRMYKNVMQGPTNDLTITFTDITGSERVVMVVICALIIVIGIYPQPILHLSEASVTQLINTVNQKLGPVGAAVNLPH
jgi:NADH-quinone oxidoreductase subunit M